MSTAIVIIAVVAVVALVVWFATSRKHPENAAMHEQPDRQGSALYHGDANDRPAGPGAEADGVAGRGQPAPGPSAETFNQNQ
jgi:type IV secretory pathway TraG/TraD family ATPase VirD4